MGDMNICLPINLDAFVLNEAVCEGGKTRIAPITQPDYVSLRLENSVIQHDVLPRVDLHSTTTALGNPRISNTYSTPLRTLDPDNPIPQAKDTVSVIESRLGVYIHWSLPRGYRAGVSSAAGTGAGNRSANVSDQPVFPTVPNRWLVVRFLKQPTSASLPAVEGWLIESDRLITIETVEKGTDLETGISPFVSYSADTADSTLNSQAENYIGIKRRLKGWSEESSAARITNLTAMNSSNPLFADYTAHNSNVFSMIDSFQDSQGKQLSQAVCDYVVIGWHSKTTDGPFGANGMKGTLAARVKSFLCSIDKNRLLAKLEPKTAAQITGSIDPSTILCHGAIYNVKWDRNVKPVPDPAHNSDQYSDNFNDSRNVEMEPVAVGTSPLNSILTFLNAHARDTAAEDRILGKDASGTAANLLALSELLYATDDEYDARVQAADLLSGQQYRASGGGFAWHYDKKKAIDNAGPPLSPSRVPDVSGFSELDYLNQLNEYQQNLDMTERMLAQYQWDLFALFFNYCSDGSGLTNADVYRDRLKRLYWFDSQTNLWSGKVIELTKTKTALETAIAHIRTPSKDPSTPLVPARKIAADPFFLRSDPTLMIAGIDPGWPAEYLKPMDVRFGQEVMSPTNPNVTTLLAGFQPAAASGTILQTITNLLNEASQWTQPDQPGFKTWQGQPFCPIFVEWEALYYHIDWSKWKPDLQSSPLSPINAPQVRYLNKESVEGLTDDCRAISGRIMILPQPTFALAAIVKQVFSTAGENIPPSMANWTLEQQNDFIDKVSKLKFVSGELTGFTDSLLTLATGSHVKPNLRQQGQTVSPLSEAVHKGGEFGMLKDHFTMIDGESAKTPYGFLTDFRGLGYQPFKGVQHGQLAITNITVVDKFGQAVACPLPGPKPRNHPDKPSFPIHPCLADQLCPTVNSDNTLNTVYTTTDPISSSLGRISPFVQITPAINQKARFNARFLQNILDQNKKSTPLWKTSSDWENPIFGWIIVNYADSCLQFFTGDGIFYTSLHFKADGTATSLKWAPFDNPAPDSTGTLVSQQLVDLIAQMQDASPNAKNYLSALWAMIGDAIQNMPFPPSQYSAYANAIVGKPLALVNVGWSLELAQAPLKAQQTLGPLPGDSSIKNNPTEEAAMAAHDFRVKIGDWSRPFDGVVCYWDTDNGKTGRTAFDKIYTYFPQEDAVLPRISIQPENFPKLIPYFIDPKAFNGGTGMAQAQAAEFTITTMLIDPYTPVHLYSGILPIKSLQLPGWTLEIAMKNMTAFFTVGPLLLTVDVPKLYDKKHPLTASSWIDQQNDPTLSPEQPVIKIPIAGGKGMWNWLQPYVDLKRTNIAIRPSPMQPPEVSSEAQALLDTLPRPLYNSFEVGQEDGRLRNDPGPYTMVEGFLQLARPLIPDP